MNQQEEIIVRELDKNPNISITDLEDMTGLPIGAFFYGLIPLMHPS
jgi:hypothetical protein